MLSPIFFMKIMVILVLTMGSYLVGLVKHSVVPADQAVIAFLMQANDQFAYLESVDILGSIFGICSN